MNGKTALAIKRLKLIHIQMLLKRKIKAILWFPDNTWAWYKWN